MLKVASYPTFCSTKIFHESVYEFQSDIIDENYFHDA